MTERKRHAFTMVEVIAVLLVLAVLAAVATPRFVNMAAEARDQAAYGGVAEALGTVNVGYAKAYLAANGVNTDVDGNDVVEAAGLAVGDNTFGDVVVTIATTADSVTVTAKSVDGTDVTAATAVNKTWNRP